MKRLAVGAIVLLLILTLPAVRADDVPGAPLNLEAERDGARIYLSWEPPEGNVTVLEYNVYRGTQPNDLLFYDSLDGNYTAGYDAEVLRDRTYFYAVSANTTAGEGAMSQVAIVEAPSNEYPVTVMALILAVTSATLTFAYWRGRGSERSP
ncbi:MAG: hypothetical protein GXY70_06070 [Euryarchaeota archaeon]|nr:hypothetical protein [Euryarchaeota archaeon]